MKKINKKIIKLLLEILKYIIVAALGYCGGDSISALF